MFTWICPQCGREVPPSYTECPDCAAKAAGAGAPPADHPPADQPGERQIYPPPPPQYQQPPYQHGQYPQPPYPYPQQPYPPQPPYGQPPGQPPQYQPPYPPPPPQYRQPAYQQPVYQQPQYAPPPPPPVSESRQAAPPPPAYNVPASEPEPPRESRGSALFGAPPAPEPRSYGMPTWLLTIICTAGFALVVLGAYWLFGTHRPSAPSTTVESPAAKPGAAANPWQKVIEVSGIRLQEDPKHKGHVLVRFVVTNHSDSTIDGLAGNVTIWAGTKKSDEDAQGTFAFTTGIGPYESKDVTAPFNTKLKIYELPDWNVMNADLQITAPGGGGSAQTP